MRSRIDRWADMDEIAGDAATAATWRGILARATLDRFAASLTAGKRRRDTKPSRNRRGVMIR